jgi:signal transduction histidine kinase
MMAISGVCITLQMFRRVREALIHGPFFLVFLGYTFYYMAALLGLADFTETTSISWQIAGLCNVFSLQVAMLLRARQSHLDAAVERERLNQALVAQNEQLEDSVALRTHKLNDALEAAHLREAEQRQFIAMPSHEARSPMEASDIVLLVLLWLQLALGLATVPLSGQHLDGSMMMKLAGWAQHIVAFSPARWNCWQRSAFSSICTCSWA